MNSNKNKLFSFFIDIQTEGYEATRLATWLFYGGKICLWDKNMF